MSPTKPLLRLARKRRIRSKIRGTSARPRLTVYCSLTRVTAQIIDDTSGRTLAFATSKAGEKNVAAAKNVGVEIAKKAKEAKVTTIVFDRNARKYHGRIKALADAAREGGLTF